MDESKDLLKLQCSVMNYDWGLQGRDSNVARLFSLNSRSQFDLDKPYAEFWMGTHDSGPSFLHDSSQSLTLKSWVSQNPHVLGDNVLHKWGSDLPFLFKVLSVGKALSIQAHPDKDLARTLHKLHPDLYKDENHKPEMALAMTQFEALCGFITLKELKAVLHTVPEVSELIGAENANLVLQTSDQDSEEKLKSVLKAVFTLLMSANKDRITDAVNRLKFRLHKESEMRQLTDKEQLVLQLEKQYPADVGVIAAFFLNLVKLNPGEALFLGPNEPHAYLSGECVECMATSDNVGSPEILRGAPLNPYVNRYIPPFEEFEIDHCVLPQGETVVFPAIPGPSIFLVTVGEGTMNTTGSPKGQLVTEGDVLFAAANTEISVTSNASKLHLYRTGTNSRFFQVS